MKTSRLSIEPRQIVAVVLPQILIELAQARAELTLVAQSMKPPTASSRTREMRPGNLRQGESRNRPSSGATDSHRKRVPQDLAREPRAVIWLRQEESTLESELEAKRPLDAVNHAAKEFGVNVGQTIAEARALVAHLGISVVGHSRLQNALERIAESMSRFGETVSFAFPDTIWVDVTGTTHLFGGEWSLLEEIRGVLDELGHQARLALADGPQLARAFAVWETRRQGKAAVVILPEQRQESVKALPISGLPLAREVKVNLTKLGLLTAGDLLARDLSVVSSRLGDEAPSVLALLRGEDTTPLAAYRPLELPEEVLDWDEPLSGNEPVLFALRRLTTQIALRLRGRAMAAQSVALTLKHDPAIARFRGRASHTRQIIQLVSPLARAEDLWRVLATRIDKIQVDVPNVGVALEVLSVEESKQRQLDLAVGFSKLDAADPERMAVLFSELASDIGAENFGTLRLANTHKPERMSLLCSVMTSQEKPKAEARRRGGLAKKTSSAEEPGNQGSLGNWRKPTPELESTSELPARLLTVPTPVQTRFRVGELLPLGPKLYTITAVRFQRRLEAVEWWSNEPCSRDYVRLDLSSTQGELQVLAYVDRITQNRYVQGWYD